MTDPLYYECHITIEPVEDERLQVFTNLCDKYSFKVASLLMQKSLKKSNLDSFTTGKDKDYERLKSRMYDLVSDLRLWNFKIYRYKIEGILLDTKTMIDK